MKDPTLEHILEILESQKVHIDKLERQVVLLANKENDNGAQDSNINKDIKTSDIKETSATENKELKEKLVLYEERIQVGKVAHYFQQNFTWDESCAKCKV